MISADFSYSLLYTLVYGYIFDADKWDCPVYTHCESYSLKATSEAVELLFRLLPPFTHPTISPLTRYGPSIGLLVSAGHPLSS